MCDILYRFGEVSEKDIFIDETKIEACANKYTFVWKKAITKNLARFLEKLAVFAEECEAKQCTSRKYSSCEGSYYQ